MEGRCTLLGSPCSLPSRAETCRVSMATLAQQPHSCPCGKVLTSNPNTFSCRTNRGLFLSPGGPGLLRTGQNSAHPCWVRLAWHTRAADPGLQGQCLFCFAAIGVGFPSSGPASVSPLVHWAGKGHPLNEVIIEPSSPHPLIHGDPDLLLPAHSTLPLTEGHHFNSCLFSKYPVLHSDEGCAGQSGREALPGGQ